MVKTKHLTNVTETLNLFMNGESTAQKTEIVSGRGDGSFHVLLLLWQPILAPPPKSGCLPPKIGQIWDHD